MAAIETKVLKTIEEIRIFSDPYRMKILDQFYKATEPSTIKEIADQLGEVPAKVYYHARKLESIGLLELKETRLINGITAKYYKAFEGSVQVRRDDVDESIRTVFASEAQKLVARMFDASKQKYLDNQSSGKKRIGTVLNSELYLNKEESEAFVEMIQDFIREHSKPASPGQEAHHFFFSFSHIEE